MAKGFLIDYENHSMTFLASSRASSFVE